VVNFDQTRRSEMLQIWYHAASGGGGGQTMSNNEKHKLYARYAAYCLDMMSIAGDSDASAIQREMATEWLRLADTLVQPATPSE